MGWFNFGINMLELSVMETPKIFGVGLSRTGTSSLTYALRILGYSAKHFPQDPLSMAKEYDALTDTTVARDYKKLDKLFPNSKFILTVRDMDSWLRSVEAHFLRNPVDTREEWVLQLREDVYKTRDFNRDLMQAAYSRHLNDVQLYFKERPTDLLIMDICNGEGWEVLCPFLSQKIPTEPFPQINVTSAKAE